MTAREKLENLGYELVETEINGKCSKFRFRHELMDNELTFYRNGNDPVVFFSSYTDVFVPDDEVPVEEPYGLTLEEYDAISSYMKYLQNPMTHLKELGWLE